MKNLLLIFAILSVSSFSDAQDSEPKFVYCQIVGTSTLMGKVTVDVDFGQKMNAWGANKLKDESGKNIKFNSMVDALNFMGKKGWEFSQAYSISQGSGGGSVYHYLLKKPYADLDAEAKAEFNKN